MSKKFVGVVVCGWVVVVVGKPNFVKDFRPRLPLDLCFDFGLGLGQAFQKNVMQV